MLITINNSLEEVSETRRCPRCGSTMAVRENTTTFWEKQKERYSYCCSNSNCLHKIALTRKEVDLLKIEQTLLKWELDIETIEQDILEKYELRELMDCLKKTLAYIREGQSKLSPKDYFLHQLRSMNKSPIQFSLASSLVPMAALAITLIVLSLLGPKIGELLKATILSVFN